MYFSDKMVLSSMMVVNPPLISFAFTSSNPNCFGSITTASVVCSVFDVFKILFS